MLSEAKSYAFDVQKQCSSACGAMFLCLQSYVLVLTELCFGTNKAMIKRKNKGKTMKILLAMTIKPPCFFMFYVFFYFLKARIADSSPKTIEQKRNRDTSHEG